MHYIFKYPGDFTLFEGEEIEMVIRHHWLTAFFIWFRWFIWGPALISGIGVGIYFFAPDFLFTDIFYLLCYGAIIFLIFYTIGTFLSWLNEIFDIILITNDRIIDITQIDFFHRTIAETRLENIQDATGNVQGFLNTIFNWGNISIQTASNTGHLAIENVENPQGEARKIFTLATKAKQNMLHKKDHLSPSIPTKPVINNIIFENDSTPHLLKDIRKNLVRTLIKK